MIVTPAKDINIESSNVIRHGNTTVVTSPLYMPEYGSYPLAVLACQQYLPTHQVYFAYGGQPTDNIRMHMLLEPLQAPIEIPKKAGALANLSERVCMRFATHAVPGATLHSAAEDCRRLQPVMSNSTTTFSGGIVRFTMNTPVITLLLQGSFLRDTGVFFDITLLTINEGI